jgi:hypothetical protein
MALSPPETLFMQANTSKASGRNEEKGNRSGLTVIICSNNNPLLLNQVCNNYKITS